MKCTVGGFLVLVLGVLAVLAAPAAAETTWTVTSTADSGSGSLRQALADAQAGDTIEFALTTPATITLNSPLIIDKAIIIGGPGADQLTLAPNVAPGTGFSSTDYVIAVQVGANAVVSGVQILGDAWVAVVGGIENAGSLSLQNSAVRQGRVRGIYNTGALSLTGSTIEDCTASESGAGIYNAGTVSLEASALLNNEATALHGLSEGGGLFNGGVATITRSTIRGNEGENGGGIANDSLLGVQLTVIESTISGNSADIYGDDAEGNGGGLFNGGTATILRSTFGENEAMGDGGAIHNAVTFAVTNTTFAENYAHGSGGAIFHSGSSDSRLQFVTIIQNVADFDGDDEGSGGGVAFSSSFGSLQVGSSVIAENVVGDPWSGSDNDCDGSGTLQSLDYNVFRHVFYCALTGLTDHTTFSGGYYGEVGVALTDHGGPTPMYAPSRSSFNLLNRIPITDCVAATDQRGVPRPQSSGCDIGAYEMATMSWDGGAGDGLWTSDANWTLDVQPGGGDLVALYGATPATITIAPSDFRNAFDLTVGGFTMSNPNLTLLQRETLNVHRGSFGMSAGRFEGASDGWLQSYDLTIGGSGVFIAPYRTLINEDFATSGGTFDANGGLVEIHEGVIDHATQTISGPLSLYDLRVKRYYTDAVVEAQGDVTVTHRLTIEKGTFLGASGYHHVQIDAEGTLALDGDITVGGDWVNDGAVATNGHAIFFTGPGPQMLQETAVVSGSAPVHVLDDGRGAGLVIAADGENLGRATVTIDLHKACTDVAGDVFTRCFDIETEQAPARGVTLTLFFYADEIPAGQTCGQAEVYHWSGSEWEAMTRDAAYGSAGRMCTAAPYSVRVQGVTDLSPFVITGDGAPPEGKPGKTVFLPLVARQ